MRQQFAKLWRDDLLTKLLALALALLLWAMVMQDYNAESTRSFDVALEVIEHPVYQIFEGRANKESRVEVRVTGPNLLVSRLDSRDLRAFVDYSRITEPGRSMDLEVQVEGPKSIPSGQVIYQAVPKTVSVTLVEMKQANVPVVVQPTSGVISVGTREFRYKAEARDLSVQIAGRADYLNLVRVGSVVLRDADLTPKLTGTELAEKETVIRAPVIPLDATGKEVEKLPRTYADVAISWEALPPGRLVKVEPKTVGALPPGLELASTQVDPISVTLRPETLNGQMPDIGLLATEPIDLSTITKTTTVPARLIAPPGTTLAVNAVEVTLVVQELKVEKVLGNLPITVRQESGPRTVDLSVRTVSVTLRGPYSVLNPIDAGSIQVYVDVTDLREGKHQVPVKVIAPPGVPEVSVDPAVVEVTISNP